MAEPMDETSGSLAAMIATALHTSRLATSLLGDGFGAEVRAARESAWRMHLAGVETAARVGKIVNDNDRADADLRRRTEESKHTERRAQEKHTAELDGYAARQAKTWVEAAAVVSDVRRRATDSEARRENEAAKADAEVELTQARTANAKADGEGRKEERRDKETRADEEHTLRMVGLRQRNRNDRRLGRLQRREVRERIAQRRRSAGLTEKLAAGQRDYSKNAADAGKFAAAQATADMGPHGPSDAKAYAERARFDGLDIDNLETDVDIADLPEDVQAQVRQAAADFTEAAADSHLADAALADAALADGDTPSVGGGSSIGEAIRAAATPIDGTGLPTLETGPGPIGPGPGAGAAPEAGL